jgi:hypothetical protein
MLILIIAYLLWRSKCKCSLKTSKNDDSEDDDDYDLEYWLKHVDKQKLEQKNFYYAMFNPTLPEACSDSKQATAAWIIEHRKIWTNMHRQDFKSFTNVTPAFLPAAKLSKPKVFINRLKKMNPLKSPHVSSVENQRSYNKKVQILKDLDCKTQLLIDYARIDAITNSSFNKMNIFNISTNPAGYSGSGNASKQPSFKISVDSNVNKRDSGAVVVVDDIICTNYNISDCGGGGFSGTDEELIDNDKNRQLKLKKKLIQSYRRRSYSWPKCKYDNRSHMSNYERIIKLNCLKLIFDRQQNNNNNNVKVGKISNESSILKVIGNNNNNNVSSTSKRINSNQKLLQQTNF